MPIAHITGENVKDMNREQELDQYEDHDTWLEMAKPDYLSFGRLLYEEQTDQQRKVCLNSVVTGQEMVREKILQDQGKVRKFYF